jgi:hypothetical protein
MEVVTMPTLFLRNIEQVALFELELKGQLSDGNWENSRPSDHWKAWCNCKAAVVPAGMQPGRNFWASRDRYGLTSKQLLDVIGGRMLGIVRVTQGVGFEAAQALRWRFHCDDDFKVSPIEIPKGEGDYWDKERAALAKFDLGVINTHLVHGNYGKKDLLKDLREIKEAMRMAVSLNDAIVQNKPEEVQL